MDPPKSFALLKLDFRKFRPQSEAKVHPKSKAVVFMCPKRMPVCSCGIPSQISV
jgi:hypothetical protein